MFDETLILVSSCITIIVIVIAIALTYYKLKLKRLNLIEKGLWKAEYEAMQNESIFVAGVILLAVGTAILLADFMIEDTESFLRALVGLVPLLLGIGLVVCFVVHRRITSPERNRNQ